jgi:hypothetical protein
MRVRCKTNRADDVAPSQRLPRLSGPSSHTYDLTVGRDYVVYAIGLGQLGPWFYIADDAFIDGPRQFPSSLFELRDPSVSRHWVMSLGHRDAEQPDMLAPAEWVREPWFFNRLVDGEPTAVAIFMELKPRLDGEATEVAAGVAGRNR